MVKIKRHWKIVRGSAVLICSLFLIPLVSYARSADSLEGILGQIPVQNGGRVKPFESFAQENALLILGKKSFEGLDATTLVWSWLGDPETWGAKPILPVGNLELRKQFSSDLVNHRLAPTLVLADLNFLKLVRTAQEKQDKKERLTDFEQKSLDLYHRASTFAEISHGVVPGFIPHPDDARISWLPLEAIRSEEGKPILENLFPSSLVQNARSTLTDLLSRLRQRRPAEAVPAAELFASSLRDLLESRSIAIDESVIHKELLYLKLKPFHLAWILYLAGIILWLSPRKTKQAHLIALIVYLAGFLMHGYGFLLRSLIAGRPPVTNMYESVIWVSWAVVLFASILWLFYRSYFIPLVASCVATFALLIGENLPTVLDPSIAPLVPVLRNNFWLTVHVLTITLSYGAFALNWGIAHVLLYRLSFVREKKETIAHLTEYLYRSLQIGIILLASGTILGGVWASYSWGRFWGWDPKETWALIALMCYLTVVHGRIAGWLDEFYVAFFSAICFLGILMTWYGVNFVLARGLHSYGFGAGGFPYVSIFVLVDVILLLFFSRRYKM